MVIVVLPVFCPATAVNDAGLGASVKPGKVAAQAAANFVASTEPKPVTSSYPTPAVNPIFPVVQPVVPTVQGTMLLPEVTSWNAPEAVFAASLYSMGLTGARPVGGTLPKF